ncbi:thioesterase family protein [Nocardia jiangxiensis]|uniref:thioesterase family protein n=1 Tax=Nocardia jiangxiensis TaxID=282685 RepID=UPI00146E848C|nr:hypothetical protein [Nocardia jiangxiensis]
MAGDADLARVAALMADRGRATILAMPRVFATGFLVGFAEWARIDALAPHLDGPDEQTVGTRIDITHDAPNPRRNERGRPGSSGAGGRAATVLRGPGRR